MYDVRIGWHASISAQWHVMYMYVFRRSGSIAPDVPVMAMAARALKYMYRVHVMYRELGGQSGRRAGQAKLTGQY